MKAILTTAEIDRLTENAGQFLLEADSTEFQGWLGNAFYEKTVYRILFNYSDKLILPSD